MPNKFWQFRNAADGSGELLLYGNIAGEKSWYSDDVTPKQAAGTCLRRWKSGTCWSSTRPP